MAIQIHVKSKHTHGDRVHEIQSNGYTGRRENRIIENTTISKYTYMFYLLKRQYDKHYNLTKLSYPSIYQIILKTFLCFGIFYSENRKEIR